MLNKNFAPQQTKSQKQTRLQATSSNKRSSPFPIIPDQIHKVPENVRKAIKVGKYRRNTYKVQNPEDLEARLYAQSFTEKEKSKIQFNVQPAFRLDAKKSQQYEQGQATDLMIHNIKNQPPKMRASGDRMLYLKKKLTPLKKGVTADPINIPGLGKKNIKITFLNVQKLQLVKMYENMQENKSNSPYKKNAFMTSSLTNKKENQLRIENFLQSTTFSTHSQFRRSLYESKKPKMKQKPFTPPFQRYFYRDFIWKVAFDNGFLLHYPQTYSQKFKIFIGRGNNSMLIKSLFKRRNQWWTFTDRYDEAHFVWTQIKINQIFHLQENNEPWYTEQMSEDLEMLNKQTQFYASHSKFMGDENILLWNEYFTKYRRIEDKLEENMSKRNKVFGMLKILKKVKHFHDVKIHNHLPNNYVLGNKKALFYTMSKYYAKTNEDVFQYLPLTFHIQNGIDDNEYLRFLNHFYDRAKKIRAREKAKKNGTFEPEGQKYTKSTRNMWIVKPGEFTNRGNGINVCMSLEEIKKILKQKQRHDNGNLKTYIIQSYLEKPFLYQRRKFDIRHFIMITSIGGRIKGYWYQYGYIRTTSFQYTLNNNLTSVHLTNDAVQKYLPEYGKYEKGNKISYQEFQKYLDKEYSGRYDFFSDVYPKLKKVATDSIKASSLTIDPERKGHNFQIFGLDFMIDSQFHPWLIEINNNPCLQLSCPLLNTIVPDMLENAFRLVIDSLIPAPEKFTQKRPKFTDNPAQKNKFELVFDSLKEEEYFAKLFNGEYVLDDLDYKELQKDEDEIFEDDGIELDD